MIIVLLRIDDTLTRSVIRIWVLEVIHLALEVREDITRYHTRGRAWFIESFLDDVGEEMRESFIVEEKFLCRHIPVPDSHFEFSSFPIYL